MSRSRRSRSESKKAGASPSAAVNRADQKLALSPTVQKYLAVFFIAATLVGLYLGLNLAFNYPLTSDSANAGLFPMEVAEHGSFEYVFPANNPYFFTDYVFHLIIQPLTGYSPVALILTGYAMYVLIVLGCAAVALRLAGRIEALAAAALVANLPFMGLRYVLYPLYHNGTILFILLSILVFYADRPPFRLDFKWRVLIIGVLQLLGVFSDTLMLPVFTLPLIAYAGYRLWTQWQAAKVEKGSVAADGGKDAPGSKSADRSRDIGGVKGASVGKGADGGEVTEGSPLLLIASTVPALIVFAAKSRIGQLWPGGPILAPSGAELGLSGLLQHPEMIGEFAGGLVRNGGGIVVAIGLLVVVLLVFLERKDRFLQAMLVMGGVFMLLGFMSMAMEGDPARYLTFTVILALVVAATGTMRRGVSYIPLIAVIAIVLVNAGSNVLLLNQPHPDYLKLQQGFVDFLASNNVTHAYSDYWSANIYTYMSGGSIVIEPVYVQDDRLMFHTMNSAPRWASVWPDGNDSEPVLVTLMGDSLYQWAQKINGTHPPVTTYQVSNGIIYIYNGSLPA
ncbi:MAG: hypothetical protein A4E28_00668 [Methanocella sp. PtaU1.Bin125]|nr:MAG: hypothetical protein A4E28_00668 [Methanocella sp. PtaU1.Bin125]